MWFGSNYVIGSPCVLCHSVHHGYLRLDTLLPMRMMGIVEIMRFYSRAQKKNRRWGFLLARNFMHLCQFAGWHSCHATREHQISRRVRSRHWVKVISSNSEQNYKEICLDSRVCVKLNYRFVIRSLRWSGWFRGDRERTKSPGYINEVQIRFYDLFSQFSLGDVLIRVLSILLMPGRSALSNDW
jgi:hypothetical protein